MGRANEPPIKREAPAGTRATPEDTTTISIPPACVRFETFGPREDVLIHATYDPDVVRIIRQLPPFARTYEAASRCWRVHPAYADKLAAVLTRLGFQVVTQ
jgi:hypothetical protein